MIDIVKAMCKAVMLIACIFILFSFLLFLVLCVKLITGFGDVISVLMVMVPVAFAVFSYMFYEFRNR